MNTHMYFQLSSPREKKRLIANTKVIGKGLPKNAELVFLHGNYVSLARKSYAKTWFVGVDLPAKHEKDRCRVMNYIGRVMAGENPPLPRYRARRSETELPAG